MYKSIFYKEWIKTRYMVMLLYIVFAAFITYVFMKASQGIKISGAINFIELIIQKDVLLITYLKYLPLLAGIVLAIVQFVPEMQNKRLKLTLHLPFGEARILNSMLVYGLLVMLAIFIPAVIALVLGLSVSFPHEVVMQNFWAGLPWFLAGLAGYFLTAWICFEPTWRQRVINIIPAAAVHFFLLDAASGAYNTFLPYLAAFIVISFFFSYYSVARFKDGAQ